MFALITSPFADLFERPEPGLPRSDELLYGTLIEILTILPNSWYEIRTFYHYKGYLKGRYMIPLAHWQKVCKKLLPSFSGELKLICQSCCDILSSPSPKSPLLLALSKGSCIFVTEEERDGYSKVLLFDGQTGWCKTTFLSPFSGYSLKAPKDEDSFRKNVTQTALSYLNTQYRWGGKSPFGIDCSGLTFMSYSLNQVLIYRDAKIEPGFPVHPISTEDKKPGDLLFFPGHVAIYLGDNHYIHSTNRPGSDGVLINSLDSNSLRYRKDLQESLICAGTIF